MLERRCMSASQLFKAFEAFIEAITDRKLQAFKKPGWMPCKAFGLTPRKAGRLGLRVAHVGKTPYLNVDEFNAYAEAQAKKPSNTNESKEASNFSQDALKAEFKVKERLTR